MLNYVIRRLLLLPLTLFFIVVVNFVIINLAPGDPVTVTEISPEGNAQRKEDATQVFGSDDRYLQFRERYGLTLPILWNTWPNLTQDQVEGKLRELSTHRFADGQEMAVKEFEARRILMGDQARFVMNHLLALARDESQPLALREAAVRYFIRGGTRQAYLGPGLSEAKKRINREISKDNYFLRGLFPKPGDSRQNWQDRLGAMEAWMQERAGTLHFERQGWEKIKTLLLETRLSRYLSRVLLLDFGTLRNDDNRTVISEVTKRFKISLTLAMLPMLLTFFLCQGFGFIMAYRQGQWPDTLLNVLFLILYATPVFVVAPFLIEKVALNHTFPFSDTPIPYNGFNSPDRLYEGLSSLQRLRDIAQHIALPLVAVMYGGLAAQSRLSRTAVLEVMRQDYVRTARAKGLSEPVVMIKHVGRNAAITIVTSIAGSLGVVLGGSLIIETIFQIDGFGKFFYDAIVNRDFNVIMFSAFAGAFLSLVGYLVADLAYTLLDPRLTLD